MMGFHWGIVCWETFILHYINCGWMNTISILMTPTYYTQQKNTFWVYLKKLFKNYAKLSHFYIKTHIIQNKFLHFPSLYFIPFNLYQWRQVSREKSIILFWIKFSTIWKIKKDLTVWYPCFIPFFFSPLEQKILTNWFWFFMVSVCSGLQKSMYDLFVVRQVKSWWTLEKVWGIQSIANLFGRKGTWNF